MPAKLLVATTNRNKVREILPLTQDLPIEIVTLADVPPVPEPPSRWSVIVENVALTGDTSDRDYNAVFSVALEGVTEPRFVMPKPPLTPS